MFLISAALNAQGGDTRSPEAVFRLVAQSLAWEIESLAQRLSVRAHVDGGLPPAFRRSSV
jgi:hypothetical protein